MKWIQQTMKAKLDGDDQQILPKPINVHGSSSMKASGRKRIKEQLIAGDPVK